MNLEDKNEPEEGHASCHSVDVGPDVDGVALALGQIPGHQGCPLHILQRYLVGVVLD